MKRLLGIFILCSVIHHIVATCDVSYCLHVLYSTGGLAVDKICPALRYAVGCLENFVKKCEHVKNDADDSNVQEFMEETRDKIDELCNMQDDQLNGGTVVGPLWGLLLLVVCVRLFINKIL
ncbi:hypothetical protein SNE40_017559 [Patella caerulea]|uniref:Uncharacterized protein n=1 Tax=Patella caerulea TaxID=87958 RepID=A0AAN8JFA0_PATCE